MTDREAMQMALYALEFNLPIIEDFGSKEQLTDCHRAITALYKSIAQPEQDKLLVDLIQEQRAEIDRLRQALAQPEPQAFYVVEENKLLDLYSVFLDEDEANSVVKHTLNGNGRVIKVVTALAQPEQEPVGWFDWDAKQELWVQVYPNTNGQPLYTAPPSKPWVSLTDNEIINTANEAPFDQMVKADDYIYIIARAIETALRSKNT